MAGLPVPRAAHAAAAGRPLGRAAQQLRAGRRSAPMLAVVALTTLLAALIIAAVTRAAAPAHRARSRRCRSAASRRASRSRRGSRCRRRPARRVRPAHAAPSRCCSTSAGGSGMRCAALDHFRREGVSNLSHDLRSPLTATVACLETLDGRWAGDAARAEDRRLVEIALRNTRNAARHGAVARRPGAARRARVQPAHRGGRRRRAARRHRACASPSARARQGVAPRTAARCEATAAPPRAELDVELFERAVANLRRQRAQVLPARQHASRSPPSARGGRVEVSVADDGPGIAGGRPAAAVRPLLPEPADGRAGHRQKAAGAWASRSSSASPSCTAATPRSRASLGRGTRVVLTLPAASSARVATSCPGA